MDSSVPIEARIDLAALSANHAALRRAAAGRALIAVVKADAYGHGAVRVVQALQAEGCEAFAVARFDELAALRDAGIRSRVLVLGGVSSDAEAAAAVALDATPVVQDTAAIERLDRAADRSHTRLSVHVEVDTGMRRMGIDPDAAPSVIASALRAAHLDLAGIATHLARADEPGAPDAAAQLAALRAVLRACAPLPAGLLIHAANSAGVLGGEALAAALPEADAVRPGLALYGVSPFATGRGEPVAHAGRTAAGAREPEAVAPSTREATGLQPVMSLVARVVALRRVRSGAGVGYGATWRAPRDTTIATISAGYADGIPWSLANRGVVIVGGMRRPMVGRVSMDFVTLDVGDGTDLRVGDAALVFGVLDGARLDVAEVAGAAGTIPYELLVRVGPRVPRRVVESTAVG